MEFTLGSVICFVLVVIRSCSGCINGYTRFDSSCYHVSRDIETWADAMSMCKFDNGNLVEINSQQENTFVSHQLKSHATEYAWIGGADLDVEGLWMWWTSKTKFAYNSWLPGQPDNGGNENCAAMHAAGGWNDHSCEQQLLYICEMPYDGSEVVG